MKRYLSLILALLLAFSLCACSEEPVEEKDRACGVYIELGANDVYTISCGTGDDCYTADQPEDGSPLQLGQTIHFDFAGEAAEGTEPCIIEYTICLYDKDMNILESKSFSDDFSNMARVNISVTRDHKIVNENEAESCGGELIVELGSRSPESGVSIAVPTVYISSSEAAAAAVNDNISSLNDTFLGNMLAKAKESYKLNKDSLEKEQTADSFSMKRFVKVARGDTAVLSLRMYDKTNLGTYSEVAITGHNYELMAGTEIKLSSIATDFSKLKSICSESILAETTGGARFEDVIFNGSYTDSLVSLISDGHWYFSADGIVFAAGSGVIADHSYGAFEFTVSYDKLSSVLKPEYLPAEAEGSSGEIEFGFYSDKPDTARLIGSEPDEGINAPLGTVKGNVYKVGVYNATVKDNGEYSVDSLLWYCSDMSEGACFAINRELKSGSELYVSYVRPDGTVKKLLLSYDKEVGIVESDANGAEKGLDISSELPYQADINKDSIDEKISAETGDDGTTKLVISSSGKTYSLNTSITSALKIRLYDIDSNGQREIYLYGKNADGNYICSVAVFANQSLELLPLDGKTVLDGRISGFSDGRLIVRSDTELAYAYSNGAFTSEIASE